MHIHLKCMHLHNQAYSVLNSESHEKCQLCTRGFGDSLEKKQKPGDRIKSVGNKHT